MPELTYGLANGFEIFASAPYTINIMDSDAFDQTRTEKEHGFSDILLGARFSLLNETFSRPSLSLTVQGIAPVGENQYSHGNLGISTGHWMAGVGIGLVKNVEPVVLYGGLSTDYYFQRRYDGVKYEPGLTFSGYYGMGLLLNDSFSINTSAKIQYRQEMVFDGKTAYGSDSMPMTMTVGTTYETWGGLIWSFDLEFGINNDAPEPVITIGFMI